MFGKNKDKNKNVDELEEINEDDIEDTASEDIVDDETVADDVVVDFEEPKTKEEIKAEEKEAKKAAKAEKKQEIKDDIEFKEDILNKRSKTRVGQTFKMYKFIIKIIICAALLAFAIILFVMKAEMVGAVYLVSGIAILLASLFRMIPLFKTSTSKRAKLVLLVQCCIHLVLGAYLVLSAFLHWNTLDVIAEKDIDGKTLKDMCLQAGGFGGLLSAFNINAYRYIMVAFFFTLSIGYYWVTILYGEKTNRSLFWIMTIANGIALVYAILPDNFDSEKLVIALGIVLIIGAIVVGGEAGGGYYRYRKALVTDRPKKEKTAEKGLETPAREEDKDYSDIDTGIIPQDDPQDGADYYS